MNSFRKYIYTTLSSNFMFTKGMPRSCDFISSKVRSVRFRQLGQLGHTLNRFAGLTVVYLAVGMYLSWAYVSIKNTYLRICIKNDKV